ncbi:MAG TPA: hypothetical protein PLZ67_07370 [Bacteroidales bacterium]|nr:hypothetical protein [Bacteroidales bacterium]
MKSKKKQQKSYRRLARTSIARVNTILKYDLDEPNDLTPFERALLEAERGDGVEAEKHEDLSDLLPNDPENNSRA